MEQWKKNIMLIEDMPRRNTFRRIFVRSLLLLFFFAFCCIVLLYAPQGFGKKQQFIVSRGEGVHQISKHLKDAGLIRSTFIFETAVWLKRRGTNIQEGEFVLSNRMSNMKLVDELSRTIGETVKVTVPEGYTLSEIYRLLGDKQISGEHDLKKLDPGDFTEFDFIQKYKSLEGFVFPETHFFKTHSDPRSILVEYVTEFQKRMIPIYEDGSNNRSFYDTLIMASIIEAEVPHEEDRPIISGILWKRLDAGMPLQVDSTLNYATGGKNASLTANELKNNSPYNTYLYPDLPPTPIGNPGESAMKAAVNPKDSPYWFFLSGKDGTTHFARDFEEHKRNKERYLR